MKSTQFARQLYSMTALLFFLSIGAIDLHASERGALPFFGTDVIERKSPSVAIASMTEPRVAGVSIQIAAETCKPATAELIARDSAGAFIPNLNFTLYEQTLDVDGKPKPGKQLGTNKISPTLGKGAVTFVPNAASYAAKVWDVNATVGESWFYNLFPELGCGETDQDTVKVSAIKFVLRDTQGELRKNTKFSLYTQRFDADSKPIKNQLVAQHTTSEKGEVTVYVADKTHAQDGNGVGLYFFEAAGSQGGVFVKHSIPVSAEATTAVTFTFSDLAFYVSDASETPYPANTKVEVYAQSTDFEGERILGSKIRDVFTNDKGYAVFENPQGTYVARVKGSDGLYSTFWDLHMEDQERNEITLETGSEFTTAPGACSEQSKVTVTARSSNGEYLPGINFELYVQTIDANGKPLAATKATGGKIGAEGTGYVLFQPDPTKTYVLKLYDRSATVGDFWYFDKIQFTCGEHKEFEKKLSSIKVILRDGADELLANTPFSVYTQKLDTDGNPLAEKKDLVVNATTGSEGSLTLYVAPDHPYIPSKKGVYALAVKKNGVDYLKYSIKVAAESETLAEYTLSDVVLDVQDAAGTSLANRSVIFYKQETDAKGKPVKSQKPVTTLKSNADGIIVFAAAPGLYVASVKDDANAEIVFWNIEVAENRRTTKDLVASLAQVTARDASETVMPEKTAIDIYTLVRDYKTGYYYRQKKAATGRIAANGYADVILTPGAYLFTVKAGGVEYVVPGYVREGKTLSVVLSAVQGAEASNNTRFKLNEQVQAFSVSTNNALIDRVKGYIVLQVESKGEAWYVDPKTKVKYYLKDGPAAYELMRKLGLGAKTSDLAKIPVGLDRISGLDTDKDGLPDTLERALGTDPEHTDSDRDSYEDGAELKAGYSAVGPGKPVLDKAFTQSVAGKILLQVESRGEAWYVNPKDGKRYYLADGPNAYTIMRFLSLGITNKDLNTIRTGTLK